MNPYKTFEISLLTLICIHAYEIEDDSQDRGDELASVSGYYIGAVPFLFVLLIWE